MRAIRTPLRYECTCGKDLIHLTSEVALDPQALTHMKETTSNLLEPSYRVVHTFIKLDSLPSQQGGKGPSESIPRLL